MANELIVAESDPVLIDTSAIISFCDAGCRREFLEYVAAQGRITIDVELELERKARTRVPVKELLREWPQQSILVLDSEAQTDALDILNLLRKPGEHEMANAGEASTIAKATQLARSQPGNDQLLLVLDDGDGRSLARARRLRAVTTPDLTIEMVLAGALSQESGERVWRAASHASQWRIYRVRLSQAGLQPS